MAAFGARGEGEGEREQGGTGDDDLLTNLPYLILYLILACTVPTVSQSAIS